MDTAALIVKVLDLGLCGVALVGLLVLDYIQHRRIERSLTRLYLLLRLSPQPVSRRKDA